MSSVLKTVWLFCMVVVLTVTACSVAPTSPTEEPTIAPEDTPTPTPIVIASPDEVGWDDRTVFAAGLISTEQAVLDGLPGATVYHIDLLIPEDFHLLEGHQELLYTNREQVTLDEIYFRLFVNTSGGRATVSEVDVDGQGVQGEYAFEQSALRVPLPSALEPGEKVVIAMDFEIEVPREMGGNYGLFGYFDDILALDEFYPIVSVYDDEGWNVENPPTAGDLPYFDASFYLVQVTAPADMVVVASGIEVGRELRENSQVLTLSAGPVRDFYLAASNRYTVVSQQLGETTVYSYAFPEYREHATLALHYATDAMRVFNRRFGAYPYVEFDVASTPMQALGIEYPGVAGMGLHLYDPQAEISGLPSQVLLQGGVAHEVAHQWFYNVVGNDQVDEPWMDEALTQYVTGLYYLELGGGEAYSGWRGSWYDRWQRVEMADIPIGLPSGEYTDAREYGAVVYGRGPIFMETLADEMGEEKFGELLRDYYQSYKWGIGTGEAFRELAEEHCECDLTALFEAWVYAK
jgi:hypothetical protein